MKWTPFIAVILAAANSADAGVPEPDVTLYRQLTISPTSVADTPAGVTWSLSGNAETLAVSQTTMVSVNGETFSLTRIPFETRQLPAHTPLPATQRSETQPALFAGQTIRE